MCTETERLQKIRVCIAAYPFNGETGIELALQKDASVNEIDVNKYFFDFDLRQDVRFLENTRHLIRAPLAMFAGVSLHGWGNSLTRSRLSH